MFWYIKDNRLVWVSNKEENYWEGTIKVDYDFLDFIKINQWYDVLIDWTNISYNEWDLYRKKQEVEKIEIQENKLKQIKEEISTTVIDYNGWKFKIRKKDIWILAWQFLLCDKTQIDPITVQDSEYNSINLTVTQFWELAKIIELKRDEIAKKYSN